jgi:hypothetical protein
LLGIRPPAIRPIKTQTLPLTTVRPR